MAETTAGITLGLEAALYYVVAAAKLGERIERDLDAAVKGAEIAGHRIFERRRTRREAGAAQRGGEDCVAGAGAGVQRLGHGSEIGREPAGQRRRDAENVGNVLARNPDEARAGHGGPHVLILLTACQPPTKDCSGADFASFKHTSKPTMKAAVTSAGVAPMFSVSGNSAGMIGEVGWPNSEDIS